MTIATTCARSCTWSPGRGSSTRSRRIWSSWRRVSKTRRRRHHSVRRNGVEMCASRALGSGCWLYKRIRKLPATDHGKFRSHSDCDKKGVHIDLTNVFETQDAFETEDLMVSFCFPPFIDVCWRVCWLRWYQESAQRFLSLLRVSTIHRVSSLLTVLVSIDVKRCTFPHYLLPLPLE